MLTLDLPTPTYVGTQVTVTMRFALAGQSRLVDPTVVTLSYLDGHGTETIWTYGSSPQLTRSRQGMYQAQILLINQGEWSVKVQGSGGCDIVDETSFAVINPTF